MFQIYQCASEIQPDDGGEQVRIERRNDKSVQLYPMEFFVGGGEEQEPARALRVTDRNRNIWIKNGNQFRPGDDKEDGNKCNKPPRQL